MSDSKLLRRYFRHGLLPQLFVFEAVARLGGVTRAAEALHLAQPTVSVQLKKLSEALEVTLFEQNGRRLKLTPAGHALRESCAELCECLLGIEERLAGWRTRASEPPPGVTDDAARGPAHVVAGFSSKQTGMYLSLCVAERAELRARSSEGGGDVYVYDLRTDDLQGGDRSR
jgi:DNA-binding transcriptional LysR family regulator